MIDEGVGGTFLGDIDLAGAGVVARCRVSREGVREAALEALALFASRAGPTEGAITFADEIGVTLVGFARGGRMNMYTRAARVGQVS